MCATVTAIKDLRSRPGRKFRPDRQLPLQSPHEIPGIDDSAALVRPGHSIIGGIVGPFNRKSGYE
jgi:hypothetical protein